MSTATPQGRDARPYRDTPDDLVLEAMRTLTEHRVGRARPDDAGGTVYWLTVRDVLSEVNATLVRRVNEATREWANGGQQGPDPREDPQYGPRPRSTIAMKLSNALVREGLVRARWFYNPSARVPRNRNEVRFALARPGDTPESIADEMTTSGRQAASELHRAVPEAPVQRTRRRRSETPIDQRPVVLHMPRELWDEAGRMATLLHMSRAEYVRQVLAGATAATREHIEADGRMPRTPEQLARDLRLGGSSSTAREA